MASPLRLAYPGTLYHVTARGNARQARSAEAQKRQGVPAVRTEGVTRARAPARLLSEGPPFPLLLETAPSNFLTTLGQ